MAAVEKRKNGWAALVLNHLMFVVICTFIMLPLGGIIKKIFGVIFSLLYYNSVHEYCRKAGKEHTQPFSDTKSSWKFPLYYGFIGNVFFWIPVILLLTVGPTITESAGKIILRLIYLVWDSPFIFLDVFTSTEYEALNAVPVTVFSLMFFVASFSGYYLGIYGNSISKIINKYKKTKKKKKTKAKDIK